MTAPDTLQPFVFEHSPLRGEIVQLDGTWQAVLERHDYPEPVRNLLGELMAAAALLSATLKFSGSMVMQMQGSGTVPLLVVECTSELTMRAVAHWKGEVQPLPLPDLLGDGRFVITLDPRDGKRSYQGIVDLAGGSVAEVLEHYMARSEQLDTRLWLAADGARACGMLLQKLPDAGQGDDDAWSRAAMLGGTLSRTELLALPPRELIRRLYHAEDVRVFEPRPVAFHCSCSRERVAAMLRMLGAAEVRAILAERGGIEVTCEFCNKRYGFDPVDAEQVLASDSAAPPGATRH